MTFERVRRCIGYAAFGVMCTLCIAAAIASVGGLLYLPGAINADQFASVTGCAVWVAASSVVPGFPLAVAFVLLLDVMGDRS